MASNAKNLAELLNTDSTVAVGDIADGSVSTAKLADDAVTNAKIGAGAVGTTEIADDAVTSGKVNPAGLNLGRRNLIINGAMNVSQRGTSLSMAHDGTIDAYLIDRFRLNMFQMDELDGTYAQVADDPLGGGGKALKWTTGTAESAIANNEYVYLTQKIEAQNLQHIQNGNSNAKSLTLSFYIKSSITGTFAVGLYKNDNTSRIFNKTYTINSANTWEKKSVTFVGDTSGGGINNDNGEGFWVNWHLAAGSDYKGGGSTSGWSDYAANKWADGHATDAVVTTAGATWLMTQCQLEVDDSATDFEHRSFAEELLLCQRYYYVLADGSANTNEHISNQYGFSSTQSEGIVHWGEMRTTPSLKHPTGTNYYMISSSGDTTSFDNMLTYKFTSRSGLLYRPNLSITHGRGYRFILNNASAYVHLDAEL